MSQTDRYLLIGANALLILACLNLLRVCAGILFEHYTGLHKRKRQERNRGDDNRPSQLNKRVRLFSGFFGKLFLCCCNFNQFPCLAVKLPDIISGAFRDLFMGVGYFTKLYDLFRKFFCLRGKFFCGFFSILCKANIQRKTCQIAPVFSIRCVCSDDRRSKLIINSLTGKRSRANAEQFLIELKNRMEPRRFQLTTDNWHIYSGYTGSVRAVFGQNVHYATETKIFAKPETFIPRQLTAVKRIRQIGEPDMKQATTCHCERTNLTVRTFTRRFTRCTIGYSKTLQNLKYAVSLFIWHFNFVRIHSAHGRTPAQECGLVAQAYKIEDLLAFTN